MFFVILVVNKLSIMFFFDRFSLFLNPNLRVENATNLVVHVFSTDGLFWKRNSLPSLTKLERRKLMQHEILFIVGLSLIAFFYSSVGHGGASGYLALMALFGFAPETIRHNALILNMLVSGIAFVSYYRAGYFRWRKVIPFLIGSIPAAYAGAHFSLNPTIYKMILGIMLIIAVVRLLLIRSKEDKQYADPQIVMALLIGIGLGFVSGLIGIGGGILLSPILMLAGFASAKQAAAASALFILLNSASGLAGLLSQPIEIQSNIVYYMAAVVVSGFAGSAYGSRTFSEYKLKLVLSVLLMAASFKLFFF